MNTILKAKTKQNYRTKTKRYKTKRFCSLMYILLPKELQSFTLPLVSSYMVTNMGHEDLVSCSFMFSY